MLIGEGEVPVGRETWQLRDNGLDTLSWNAGQVPTQTLLHPRVVGMSETVLAGSEVAITQSLDQDCGDFAMESSNRD